MEKLNETRVEELEGNLEQSIKYAKSMMEKNAILEEENASQEKEIENLTTELNRVKRMNVGMEEKLRLLKADNYADGIESEILREKMESLNLILTERDKLKLKNEELGAKSKKYHKKT